MVNSDKNPRHSKYFEGVLQLRNHTQEIKDYINSQFPEDGSIFVSKVMKVSGGVDMFISSRRFLLKLGRNLQSRFGGEMKASPEHFSQDRMTSKNIYRVNVLYRYRGIKKGDMISYRDETVRVDHIGKELHCINPITGNKYRIKYSDLPQH